MNTIKIKELNHEVTVEEANNVVGGYKYKLTNVVVSSYDTSGQADATRRNPSLKTSR